MLYHTGDTVALLAPNGQSTLGQFVRANYLDSDQVQARVPGLNVSSLDLVSTTLTSGEIEYYLAGDLGIMTDATAETGERYDRLPVFGVCAVENPVLQVPVELTAEMVDALADPYSD